MGEKWPFPLKLDLYISEFKQVSLQEKSPLEILIKIHILKCFLKGFLDNDVLLLITPTVQNASIHSGIP